MGLETIVFYRECICNDDQWDQSITNLRNPRLAKVLQVTVRRVEIKTLKSLIVRRAYGSTSVERVPEGDDIILVPEDKSCKSVCGDVAMRGNEVTDVPDGFKELPVLVRLRGRCVPH